MTQTAGAFTCRFCGEFFKDFDTTTCDECGIRLCVHCCHTITSEDVVCPPCYHEAVMTENDA